MADKRKAFLKSYDEVLPFIPFLSSFFLTTPRDIVRAETVSLDVRRGSRKIAPVISDITQIGGRIKKSIYTQKEFKPPVVALSGDFNPGDLINKAFGLTEYQTADESYQAQLQLNIMDVMDEIEREIMRNPEFQASQLFQTGTMTLYDKDGNAAYVIDFKPKSTHFPTVTTSWSNAAADPDADITALRRVIKKDSGADIKNLVFGEAAWENYLRNTDVKDKFDNRRIFSGDVDPQEANPDADYLGRILIGNKRMDAWLYEGVYEDPTSPGTTKTFVDTDKVLLIPDPKGANVDFRKVWCMVPTITGVDPRFADLVPASMELDGRQLTTRVWVEGSSDTLNVELKARPLCIPVSIDSFGALDTEI